MVKSNLNIYTHTTGKLVGIRGLVFKMSNCRPFWNIFVEAQCSTAKWSEVGYTVLSLLPKIFNMGKKQSRSCEIPKFKFRCKEFYFRWDTNMSSWLTIKGHEQGEERKEKVYCGIPCCMTATATIHWKTNPASPYTWHLLY